MHEQSTHISTNCRDDFNRRVFVNSRGFRFAAYARYGGEMMAVSAKGLFHTKEEAATAYADASAKYYGEFGRVA